MFCWRSSINRASLSLEVIKIARGDVNIMISLALVIYYNLSFFWIEGRSIGEEIDIRDKK